MDNGGRFDILSSFEFLKKGKKSSDAMTSFIGSFRQLKNTIATTTKLEEEEEEVSF